MFAVLKSMTGIAVMIGGGLIPFIFYVRDIVTSPWMGGVIFLLAVILFQFLVIFRLSKKASTAAWHDREYLLLKNRWKYTLNNDFETLSGECECERHMRCLNRSISYLSIEIGPAESLLPFDPNEHYDVFLLESRREKGSVSLRQPHRKEGASFAFRIDFDPPLTQGELVYVRFRYRLPRFKIANMELLREKVSKAKLEPREYEYNSFSISYDICKFVYEIAFDSLCKIKPKGIEVRRGTDVFIEEQERVIKNNWFRCEQNDGAWRMILEREHPPMKTAYRFKWLPPSKDELIQ